MFWGKVKSHGILTRVRIISSCMMQEIEWDPAKAAANNRKHGVSFDQAALAFRDIFAVEWIDTRKCYGEERVILVGTSEGRKLTVVYTERGERIRIISARRATKDEQNRYYRENGY